MGGTDLPPWAGLLLWGAQAQMFWTEALGDSSLKCPARAVTAPPTDRQAAAPAWPGARSLLLTGFVTAAVEPTLGCPLAGRVLLSQ